MAKKGSGLLELYEDLRKDDDDEYFKKFAFLMGCLIHELESSVEEADQVLIPDCLVEIHRPDLLRKYFSSYPLRTKSKLSYKETRVKPFRIFLLRLYEEMTENEEICDLFALADEEIACGDILKSFCDLDRKLGQNYSEFVEKLGGVMSRKRNSSELFQLVEEIREFHLSATEPDRLGQQSDETDDKILSGAGAAGDSKLEAKQVKPYQYPIKNGVKFGYCLIINNVEFEDPVRYKYRSGSDKDAVDLEKVFSDLNYSVQVERNVSFKKLMDIIRNLKDKDFRQVNVFVTLVLSHGEKEVFILSDCTKIDILTQFQTEFLPNKFPKLQLIPKLFFIQACQGKKQFETFTVSEEVDNLTIENNLEADAGSEKPTEIDTYIATSSAPYYYSQRNTSSGAWFIQTLCKVLRIHAKQYDINTVMGMVTDELSNMRGNAGQMQVCSVMKNTLRGSCFLAFPSSNAHQR